MPFKDPEKSKLYFKEYYQKNKQKKKEQHKEYREKNKEQRKEYNKEYNKLHPKSQYTICKDNWKKRNVLDTFNDNYHTLYRIYKSTKFCDDCATQLDNCNKSRKCLDHCHQSGYFRGVVCHRCNMKRK